MSSLSPHRPAWRSAWVLFPLCVGCTKLQDEPAPERSRDAAAPEAAAPRAPRLTFEAVELPGVALATDFAFLPGSPGELVVLSLDGVVHRLRLDASGARALGRTELVVYQNEGCGLHSLAVDPRFAENRFVYLTRCLDNRRSSLTRHVLEATGVLANEAEILVVSLEQDPPEYWHRFGSLGFEPDGETMWVLLGDHFVRQNAQDASSPFGALLRIVPDRSSGGSGYTAALGNAFAAGAGDPSVYAYGLRSPWRGTRDQRGRFFIGDVGEYRVEEVNLVSAAGQNLGWPRYEGACSEGCEGFTNPLATYGRSSEEPYVVDDPDTNPQTRRAVWVGEVYESPSVQRYYGLFDGRVVFGDFYTGWVRALRVDDEGGLVDDVPVGHLTSVSAWHTGPDGFMYALTHDGTLHRAVQVLEQ